MIEQATFWPSDGGHSPQLKETLCDNGQSGATGFHENVRVLELASANLTFSGGAKTLIVQCEQYQRKKIINK